MSRKEHDSQDAHPQSLRAAGETSVRLLLAEFQMYRLEAGDYLTLLDLGGVFVPSPCRTEMDRLADRVATSLQERASASRAC